MPTFGCLSTMFPTGDRTWRPMADVSAVVSRRQAIVSVKDEGEGIPLSEQGRVFERFHRVANGLTRETSGTGLGLCIAKRLAEAMDGHLWLDSTLGRGCTFSFELPLAQEPDSSVGTLSGSSRDDPATLRTLAGSG